MVRWPQLVDGYESLFRYAEEADDPCVRAFYNRFAESTEGFLRASREARFPELLAASGTLQSTILGFDPSTSTIGLMATLSLRPYTRLGVPFRGVFMRDLRALPNRKLCSTWRDIYERLLDGFRDLPGLDGARCILTAVHAENRGWLVALRRLSRRGIHYAPVGEFSESHAVLSEADFAASPELAAWLAAAADVEVASVPISNAEALAFIEQQDAAYDVADDVRALVESATRGSGAAPFADARWLVARRGGAIVGCVCPIQTGPYKRYAVPRSLAERAAFYAQPYFQRPSAARTDLFGFRVASSHHVGDAEGQASIATRLLLEATRSVCTPAESAAWMCFRDAAWNPLPRALSETRVRRHTYQVFEVCQEAPQEAPSWRLAWEPLFLS